MKICKRAYAYHGITLLILFVCLGGGISSASIRHMSVSSQGQELSVSELLKLPGKVLAKGTNDKPVGKLKIVTYRVEEVALPHPAEVKISGRKEQVTRAFRVTITGGPFPVRALPPVVWIGDVAVGYGVESEDLDEITAVTFDYSLFRDGVTIYLSYGDKENKEGRAELPEKLKFKVAKEGQL